MAQNKSTAVMQRRIAGTDWLDLYPTPCWATRALCNWLEGSVGSLDRLSCWEPAAGLGDMVKPLREYFREVYASDVDAHNGGHEVSDFLWPDDRRADFIITNPPFKLAEQFISTALDRSARGVAMLVRSAFLEGVGRHARIYSKIPPSAVLQFTERVVMHHGKLSKTGSTATAYCWVVWLKGPQTGSRIHWLAPCRKRLEREGDYPEEASA